MNAGRRHLDYLEDVYGAMLKSQEFVSGISYEEAVSMRSTRCTRHVLACSQIGGGCVSASNFLAWLASSSARVRVISGLLAPLSAQIHANFCQGECHL